MTRFVKLVGTIALCLTATASVSVNAQMYYPPAGPGVGGGGYPMMDQYVRQNPTWDSAGPIEQMITQTFTKSWFRFEYMLWSFDEPGDFRLGAPLSLDEPFDTGINSTLSAGDVNTGDVQDILGIVPDLSQASLNDVSGLRATMGIPFRTGSFEISLFGTDKIRSASGFAGLNSVRDLVTNINLNRADPVTDFNSFENYPAAVIPLRTSGFAPTGANPPFILLDDTFRTELSSRAWGAEINLFNSPNQSGRGLQLQPVIGARFFSLDEDFSMGGFSSTGNDADGDGIPDSGNRLSVGSLTQNNIYGPTAGFRVGFVHERFSWEVTPRLTLGLNNYKSQVYSDYSISGEQLGSIAPIVTDGLDEESKDVEFTTIAQISGNVRINLTSSFAFFGGYDAIWLSSVTRAYDNVFYNSVNGTPMIGLANTNDGMFIHGFTVGGECRF